MTKQVSNLGWVDSYLALSFILLGQQVSRNSQTQPAWSLCTTRKVPFQFPPVKVIVSRGFCALVRQRTASDAAADAAAAKAARGPRGSAAARAAHSGREGQRGLPRRRVLVGGRGQLAAAITGYLVQI